MARTIARDHDDKRARILRVAAQVFAAQGFARASMSQVAEACGISKANIYHYYDSKELLLFDILDRYLTALRDRLLTLPLDGLEPDEKLRRTLRDLLLAYEGMDHEHKIQTEGIPLLEPHLQDILKDHQRQMVAMMSALLEEIAPRAFQGRPAHLRGTTMSIFGMLNWFYMWNSKAGQDARLHYADLVCDLLLGGVRGLSADLGPEGTGHAP